MAALEQVEKLRERADVTFEEAKAALDASNGDLLDAMIYLEKQGKVVTPAGGGRYSSESAPPPDGGNERARRGESFKDMMKGLGRFLMNLFEKGNSNYLDAMKNGETVLSCPVTVLVVLLVFLFWGIVPLMILSLFFGFRYRFRGAELGREAVNKVMSDASDAVEGLKSSFENKKGE
ncbi:MAG: ubiquitin [Oscillospiraceae bacterium]|jgi:hypothetical protein|nr:ubiquitin [Oscillospiraceae bacterium]